MTTLIRMSSLLSACIICLVLPVSVESFRFIHHDYNAMVEVLLNAHDKCPNITRVYNLTEPSVEGRNLTVIEITENPGVHVAGKPEFKYVGNMHGNEVVGREVLLKLVDDLCDKYLAQDPTTRFLVANTRIHIMPSMNPDGWEKAYKKMKETGKADWLVGRANANGVDLNRNFPDLNKVIYENEKSGKIRNNHLEKLEEALKQKSDIQPETRAVMRWLASIPFVLSANLHGGDLVANYPYDATRSGKAQEYTKSPDDATFRALASSYADAHQLMAKEHPPCDMTGDDNFAKQGGITNGGAWYSVPGGMQDYNYLETNCFEITLELGCDKFPPEEDLPDYWRQNKDALVNFMLQSHIGVKGIVTDVNKKALKGVEIKVVDLITDKYIRHDVIDNKDGDYYRLLTDGYYRIVANATGMQPHSKCVSVYNEPQNLVSAQTLNFRLVGKAEEPLDSTEDEAHCALLEEKARVYNKKLQEDLLLLEEVRQLLRAKDWAEVRQEILQYYQ